MDGIEKTIKFKMTFPEKMIGDPILYRLSQDLGVAPNILRGRITENDAWLEVELIGVEENIGKAVEFLGEQGVSIEKLED